MWIKFLSNVKVSNKFVTGYLSYGMASIVVYYWISNPVKCMLQKASVNLGTSKLYRDLLAVMITYLETPNICCRRRRRHLSFKYHKSKHKRWSIENALLSTHGNQVGCQHFEVGIDVRIGYTNRATVILFECTPWIVRISKHYLT